MAHVSAASGWDIGPPVHPTIGIGLRKRLGNDLALRAGIGVGFGISDNGVGFALIPSVSLSIPVGWYPADRASR
jgi:hypothetical protein